METVSLRELKHKVGSGEQSLRFLAQLERHQQRTTKNGSPYYELTFADSEESLTLRVWENTSMFASCGQLRERNAYEISGDFGLGNDGKSVDSRGWTIRALGEDEAEALWAGSEELRLRQEADYNFIEESIASLADPRLHALGRRFLENFGERLKRTGAARDYHHARRGGLVEHVAQMMRSAIAICTAYPKLNRDLLVTGVLFHDIGKLWENAYTEKGFTMPYTEISELLGHISLGMEIVNRLWRELTDDETIAASWRDLEPGSDQVRLHLLHLIASHHGELAFGSPIVPKTPEAQALHYIDNLDAKMEMFDRGYEVATELAKHVYDRVRPLPGRLVARLPSFVGSAVENQVPEELEAGEPSDAISGTDEVAPDVTSAE
jgi:3'-5' exoribonuclease